MPYKVITTEYPTLMSATYQRLFRVETQRRWRQEKHISTIQCHQSTEYAYVIDNPILLIIVG